jgi:acetyl esterase/lipase
MSGFDPKKYGTTQSDVVYCMLDGTPLGMDLYYPRSGGPWPAVVFVHGGGWSEGDKGGLAFNPSQFGYLVASINYRLYPQARFPAMIEDVKCAIRHLRAHAREYNLDPERIGLIGHSAGSHLVSLAGLADESAGWDAGPDLDRSSRVQAVVAVSGPADLTRTFPDWVEELKRSVFGDAQLVSGSPVSYVHPEAPPFLIVHGDADPVVPVEQAYLFQRALENARVPVELIILHNGGHGLEPVGGALEPPIERVFLRVMEFLDSKLLFTGTIRPPLFLQPWLTRARMAFGLLDMKIRAGSSAP